MDLRTTFPLSLLYNKITTNYKTMLYKHATKHVFWVDLLERRDTQPCVSTCHQIVTRQKFCLLFPHSVYSATMAIYIKATIKSYQ